MASNQGPKHLLRGWQAKSLSTGTATLVHFSATAWSYLLPQNLVIILTVLKEMVHTIRVTSEIPKLGCGDTHSPPLLFCSHYTQACTRTWTTCLDEHPRGLSASSVKAWEKPYRSDSTKSKYKCSPVFVNTCSFCILWKYALLPKYSCYSSCEGSWQIPKYSFQTIFEIHLLDHSHRDQHPCIFFLYLSLHGVYGVLVWAWKDTFPKLPLAREVFVHATRSWRKGLHLHHSFTTQCKNFLLFHYRI